MYQNEDIRGSYIYVTGYCVWLIGFLITRLQLNEYLPNVLNTSMRMMGLVIVGSSIFFATKIKIKNLIIGIAILAFFLVNNGILAGNKTFIEFCILVFFAQVVNTKLLLKVSLLTTGLFYSTVIFLGYNNIIPNTIVYSDGRIRNNLGFIWSTWPVQGFFYFVVGYIFVKNKNVKNYELLIFEIINIFLYSVTKTKSPYYLITFLLLTVLVLKYLNIYIVKQKIVKIIFLFGTIYQFILIYFLSKNVYLFPEIDKLVTGRLTLAYNAINRFGISLFGRKIQLVASTNTNFGLGSQYNYIDSSYIQYLVLYGIISTLIFGACLIYLQVYIIKSKNFIKVIAFYFILLNGMFDPQLIDVSYNYFLILLGPVLFNGISSTMESDKYELNRL